MLLEIVIVMHGACDFKLHLVGIETTMSWLKIASLLFIGSLGFKQIEIRLRWFRGGITYRSNITETTNRLSWQHCPRMPSSNERKAILNQNRRIL